jgi:hypothetical protein
MKTSEHSPSFVEKSSIIQERKEHYPIESDDLKKNARNYMHFKDPSLRKAFEEWVQKQNVKNMQHVCHSFYCNRLYYSGEMERHKNYKKFSKDHFDTSLESLERVYTVEEKRSMLQGFHFRIKAGYNAAKALKSLIFSHTSLDCRAAINIAFYLTLHNVIELYHGDNADEVFNTLFGGASADKSFNKLFGKQRLLQERFTFGGDCISYIEKEYMICPVQYFTQFVDNISLSDLSKHPENYLGMKLHIKGHPDYLKNHPEGFSQAWNVVFQGLNDAGEPLFLGARRPGEKFSLTYDEFINVLLRNHNSFPERRLEKYGNFFATKKEIKGFLKHGIKFNTDLLLRVTEVNFLRLELHQFIKESQKFKAEQINLEKHSYLESLLDSPQSVIKGKIKPFTSVDTSYNSDAQLSKGRKLI